MASKSRSKAELKSEIKYLRTGKTFELAASIINGIFKWGGSCLIMYFIYLSIDALAGKFTMADIKVVTGLVTERPNSKSTNWWPFFGIAGCIVGILGLIYGWGQRKLRQSYIEHRPDRYEKLEKIIDQKRSSSLLTSKGDTRPEDL